MTSQVDLPEDGRSGPTQSSSAHVELVALDGKLAVVLGPLDEYRVTQQHEIIRLAKEMRRFVRAYSHREKIAPQGMTKSEVTGFNERMQSLTHQLNEWVEPGLGGLHVECLVDSAVRNLDDESAVIVCLAGFMNVCVTAMEVDSRRISHNHFSLGSGGFLRFSASAPGALCNVWVTAFSPDVAVVAVSHYDLRLDGNLARCTHRIGWSGKAAGDGVPL